METLVIFNVLTGMAVILFVGVASIYFWMRS
jgi:hypothetical protein